MIPITQMLDTAKVDVSLTRTVLFKNRINIPSEQLTEQKNSMQRLMPQNNAMKVKACVCKKRRASDAMGWLLLVIAGGLEVIWLIALKMSAGFTHLWPSVFAIAAVNASFATLGLALKTVPASTAYATWTGIGAAGAAIAGIWLFNEPVSVLRILSITVLIVGIVGLKLTELQ